MDNSEIEARILLNIALPANEGRLRKHLYKLPAKKALDFLLNTEPNQRWLELSLTRARSRLSAFDLQPSLKTAEKMRLKIINPEEIEGMMDLESQAPWVLFGTSNIPNLDFSAVVGTRSSSAIGRRIAKDITRKLDGLVSGGAVGIDLHAHKQAKLDSIPQVMVLAGGLDRVYPRQAKEFIRSGFEGAVISEMPPGVSSGKLGYLNRNRLIAAICKRLYLIEAPVISGSINTAQHALNLNREVTVCTTDNSEYSPGGNWFAKKPGVIAESFAQVETR